MTTSVYVCVCVYARGTVKQTAGSQRVFLAFEDGDEGKGENEGMKCQTYVLQID